MFAYHLSDALLTRHTTISGDDYDNNADIKIIMAMIMIINADNNDEGLLINSNLS